MRAVASSPGGYFPDNGLYGEAPPERGTFFRLQLSEGQLFDYLKYMKGLEICSL